MMRRGLFAFLVLCCTTLSWAQQRTIPNDMNVAVLKSVALPYIELDSGGFSWTKLLTLGLAGGNTTTVQISRLVRIEDENNRTMVMGRLSAKAGKTVAVRLDGAGVIREIWILSDDEIERHRQAAE